MVNSVNIMIHIIMVHIRTVNIYYLPMICIGTHA